MRGGAALRAFDQVNDKVNEVRLESERLSLVVVNFVVNFVGAAKPRLSRDGRGYEYE